MEGSDEIKKPTVGKTEAEVVQEKLTFIAQQLADATKIRNDLVLDVGEEEVRLKDLESVQNDLGGTYDDFAKQNAAAIADLRQRVEVKMQRLQAAQAAVDRLIIEKETVEEEMRQKRN